MATEREIIYLAALLHDIGKFWQRADPHGAANSRILSPETKALEAKLCPRYSGSYSHKHVLWTAEYFRKIAPVLEEIIGADRSSLNVDALTRISAAHHNPDSNNLLELMLQKADHYASGSDRSKKDSGGWKDAQEESDTNWDAFRRIRMRSIFEAIDPDNAEKVNYSPRYSYKQPVLEMRLAKEYFPLAGGDENPDYQSLWDRFYGETTKVRGQSLRSMAETMLYLLEKYTSHIPSSTVHLPDVSLFDHSKMVAAFAVCLLDFVRDHGRNSLPGPEEKPFALIGGDVSGIQKFIYSIIARGAAKNLKGRSFYLQLLVDTVVRRILDELDLFDANVVYASGGTFYIIAPNRKDLPHLLSKVEQEITSQLFKYHGTDLYLMLTHVPFGEQELYYDAKYRDDYQKGLRRSISEVWRNVAENLGARKGQRFRYQIAASYGSFFEPIQEGGDLVRDAITGEPIKGRSVKIDDNREVSPYTYQMIELGKRLKGAQFWVQSRKEIPGMKDQGFQVMDLPYYHYFVSSKRLRSIESMLTSLGGGRIIFFNSESDNGSGGFGAIDFLQTSPNATDNVYGFTFYGGNDYPESSADEGPKTFEELCGIVFADKDRKKRLAAPGLVRLGILRMDVDRLGAIFQRGFAPDKRTFSRYSTLSRSLDYFFKGYLNKIRELREDYTEFTQIIYSGGDDLFIVGKWDVLVDMARDIQKSFKEWVCNSDQFTLSGGMAIVGPKYPLLKGAILAEHFEKQSKNHTFRKKNEGVTTEISKNAFAIFDYDTFHENHVEEVVFSLNWESELSFLWDLKDQFMDLLENGLSQGFPSVLFNLLERANFRYSDEKNRYELTYLPVIWQAAYKFKRDSQATQKDNIRAFLQEWVSNLMQHRIRGKEGLSYSKYHPLQYLAIAARWASLEKRSEITNQA